jgi:tRNA threonylcarbamoyladenosine biosynthesis protein TsaB
MTTHLLALETSSSICGVALLSHDAAHTRVQSLQHDATGEHAERLLPMVDQLLEQAGLLAGQINAVAFGQGPGGFTGLRVACGVAQGMAFGLGVPVLPVDSLMAVAARACNQNMHSAGSQALHVVMQDARMSEVYLGAYVQQAGQWHTVQEPVLIGVEHVVQWLQSACHGWQAGHPLYFVGDALQAYPALREGLQTLPGCSVGPALRADAESVAQLALKLHQRGLGIQPDFAAPLYVRDKVAFTTREREQGAGGNPRAAQPAVLLPMTPHHLQAVAEIEQRVQSFPWTLRNFSDGLQAGYGAWVLCQGERVVAFSMTMYAPDVAHLLVIAVHPDSRRQGLATRLLAHCEQQARDRGLPALILEVRPSNHTALAFYKAHGFTQLAVRKDYYPAGHGLREDALVMQKVVS